MRKVVLYSCDQLISECELLNLLLSFSALVVFNLLWHYRFVNFFLGLGLGLVFFPPPILIFLVFLFCSCLCYFCNLVYYLLKYHMFLQIFE